MAKTTAARANYDQLIRLPRDNWTAGDYWLMTDTATVTITAQKFGESPSAQVTMSRAEFNRLLRGYQREHELSPTKRRKRTLP
jgi:hypothetical protein